MLLNSGFSREAIEAQNLEAGGFRCVLLLERPASTTCFSCCLCWNRYFQFHAFSRQQPTIVRTAHLFLMWVDTFTSKKMYLEEVDNFPVSIMYKQNNSVGKIISSGQARIEGNTIVREAYDSSGSKTQHDTQVSLTPSASILFLTSPHFQWVTSKLPKKKKNLRYLTFLL